MKNIIKYIMPLSFAVAISSCEKKVDWVNEYDTVVSGNSSYLKIVHAAPNFRNIVGHPDSFNVYVGAEKLNNALFTYNSVFPFSVNATTNSFTATYAAVPPGAQEVRLSLQGVTNRDSLTILTIPKTFDAGQYYTLMLTDSILFERDSSRILVNDDHLDIPILPNNLKMRFIHAVYNDTAGKNIDVFSYARNANIISNVPPGRITAFNAYSFNQGVVDTFYVRRAGTTQVLAKIPFNSAAAGSSNLNGRVYTMYYKGNADLTSGAKARSLAVYINK